MLAQISLLCYGVFRACAHVLRRMTSTSSNFKLRRILAMRSQSKVEENRNLKHPRPFRPADGKLPASKGAPHPEMQGSRRPRAPPARDEAPRRPPADILTS